jgi:hypothetical protein
MLFTMRVMESIGLKVKKPMILEVDNQGTIDWVNSWSVGGQMRHIDFRHHFLRDLREDGLMKVVWIKSENNSSDMFTKNLPGPMFEKHAAVYVGLDEYMQYAVQGEGVGNIVGVVGPRMIGDGIIGPNGTNGPTEEEMKLKSEALKQGLNSNPKRSLKHNK